MCVCVQLGGSFSIEVSTQGAPMDAAEKQAVEARERIIGAEHHGIGVSPRLVGSGTLQQLLRGVLAGSGLQT